VSFTDLQAIIHMPLKNTFHVLQILAVPVICCQDHFTFFASRRACNEAFFDCMVCKNWGSGYEDFFGCEVCDTAAKRCPLQVADF